MNAFRPRQVVLGLALVLVLPGSPPLAAADNPGFVVIVNEASPLESVSREELARVFLKKTARWANGLSATPVDQVEGSPVREAFSRAVLKKDVATAKAYWQIQIFSGKAVPPVEKKNDREIMDYVAVTSGAVGYVAEIEAEHRVKPVAVTE
jgi:ABC-type phosphate transport system substrate-binding protein